MFIEYFTELLPQTSRKMLSWPVLLIVNNVNCTYIELVKFPVMRICILIYA